MNVDHNVRCHFPSLWCDWADNDEWYVCLTFGNRHCDPLIGFTVTVKGEWLRRFGDWWLEHRQ